MTFRLGDTARVRGSPIARKCWRKERWKTKAQAEAQLRSLLKRGLAKDEARIHTYRCPFCAGWHTGHTKRKDDQ